ncbi:hypothetical protein AYM40_24555 [Paraburkholderia phytofirmans OLGA172]|uniref:Zinc ribbon domain-containing protein n=1 Tax=Paraburkholderia phytofirmans OLGA172 TaxID=1417228 RepID=A0A160FRR1_9BURK|nr:hypothetical protein [Paraburkholderia phytofirmans]ANB75531.1 hypothetical protein AYM40_24555 [Paraburkholderia phytofirmans OLGA172]
MSTQTILGHSFPMPCKRCGGALYRQVDYCPYCGAVHPLDAGPHKRTVIPGSRASAMSKTAQNSGSAPAQPNETKLAEQTAFPDEAAPIEPPMQVPVFATVPPRADPPLADPPLAEPPHSDGRSVLPLHRVLLAIAAIGAIGLAYVAYALFSGNHESQNDNTEQTADTPQDARTATGTIAPYAPAQATNRATASKPATPTTSAEAGPVISFTPIVPPLAATPAKPAAPQFRDTAQALQAARLALRANDLSAAQAALGAAQTLQPGNSDAQSLLTELRPLAARRDAALQAAQACAAQQSWSCARQHANEALAIDTGNDTAKTILERVIRETGWAPLEPHAALDSPGSDKSFGDRIS